MSKAILPKTDAEWGAWEAEESKKDEAYIADVLKADPQLHCSAGPRNSSKPFNLESFKETSKVLIGAYAGGAS